MKGKEAAAAARRRVAELEAELAACLDKAARDRQAGAERERDLRDEISRLSMRLAREVSAIADKRVQDAVERVTTEWHAERDAHRERLRAACRLLAKDEETRFSRAALARFMSTLGIDGSDLFDESVNREKRRVRAADLNVHNEVERTPLFNGLR